MRYHYKRPRIYNGMFAKTYFIEHEVYSRCTLYKIGSTGLAVIQQRYNSETKSTYWTEIDKWLVDDIYLNPGFKEYFNERAETPTDGLYPTVTVRQIMWALKMKPLPRQKWETVFDRKFV